MTDPMRRLACGCLRRISLKAYPEKQAHPDDAYCRRHGVTLILHTFMEEYHAWCFDCGWGRWTGQQSGVASYASGKHQAAHPGHRTVWRLDRHTRDGRGALRRLERPPTRPDTLPIEGLDAPPDESRVGTTERGYPPPPF